MTCKQLQKMCRDRGLAVGGIKSALVSRLSADDNDPELSKLDTSTRERFNDLRQQTAIQLRTLCGRKGLAITGAKRKLILRILDNESSSRHRDGSSNMNRRGGKASTDSSPSTNAQCPALSTQPELIDLTSSSKPKGGGKRDKHKRRDKIGSKQRKRTKSKKKNNNHPHQKSIKKYHRQEGQHHQCHTQSKF